MRDSKKKKSGEGNERGKHCDITKGKARAFRFDEEKKIKKKKENSSICKSSDAHRNS